MHDFADDRHFEHQLVGTITKLWRSLVNSRYDESEATKTSENGKPPLLHKL